MGSCCIKDREESLSMSSIHFEELMEIKIKERNSKGKVIGLDRVLFRMKKPIEQKTDSFRIGPMSLNIQGAVLPNMDPKSQILKECQDSYFFDCREEAVLAGLFDGHGEKGLQVVQFCIKFMKSYFHDNFAAFCSLPEEALRAMILQTDSELRAIEHINCRNSGTTAVILFVYDNQLFSASVGDSRAVLATSAYQEYTDTNPLPEENRFKRKVDPVRNLYPVQLTVDHKPNHEHELLRISDMGGVVEQIIDKNGHGIGPYRVWVRGRDYPGIAMSRSIGDSTATKVGVIAEPTVHSCKIYPGIDCFIMAGSDGLWDVFSNVEAINFVEGFRGRCQRNSNTSVVYPVTVRFTQPVNTTVAHLLAEEARYRWLGVCEEEDVLVDDISVLIIELVCPHLTYLEVPDRRSENFRSIINIEQSPRVINEDRLDAKRISFIPNKDVKSSDEEKELEEIPFTED